MVDIELASIHSQQIEGGDSTYMPSGSIESQLYTIDAKLALIQSQQINSKGSTFLSSDEIEP
jgi:hypothetical protein